MQKNIYGDIKICALYVKQEKYNIPSSMPPLHTHTQPSTLYPEAL